MGNNTNIEALTLSDSTNELLDKLHRMIRDHIPAAALDWTLEALDDFTAAVYADGVNAATTDADSGDSTESDTTGDDPGEGNTDDTTGDDPGEGDTDDTDTDDTTGDNPGESE